MTKQKILIVDDEVDLVRSLSIWLCANGYEVVTATDGVEATKMAIHEQPDVIILDIGMPAGDGHVVAERLRDSPKTWPIPIIFLTASASEQDHQRATEQGAVMYITKPFDPDKLLTAIGAILSSEKADLTGS